MNMSQLIAALAGTSCAADVAPISPKSLNWVRMSLKCQFVFCVVGDRSGSVIMLLPTSLTSPVFKPNNYCNRKRFALYSAPAYLVCTFPPLLHLPLVLPPLSAPAPAPSLQAAASVKQTEKTCLAHIRPQTTRMTLAAAWWVVVAILNLPTCPNHCLKNPTLVSLKSPPR